MHFLKLSILGKFYVFLEENSASWVKSKHHFQNNVFYDLISTSTPAGNSKRIKASIVFVN